MTHKIYEVKKGDTLWKICKDAFKLNSDAEIAKKVKEISKKNQISENSIFVGQKIDLSVTEANSNTYTDNVDIVIFSNNENNIYPETNVWETCTPYFEKRNIHFYVNRLKFHIVEYYNSKNPDPNMPNDYQESNEFDGMFKFEKVMREVK